MITIKKIAVIFALSIVHQNAYAATYYIDSTLGNDSWSGMLPTKAASPSTDGPWQSLNRLATAALSPGDVVELQCGSKWIQTLRLKNSGTPDLPITIRPTSSTCDAPPSIDGGQNIDAHSWVPHNNVIYKASWPNQKFLNGSVASGVMGWNSWSAAGDQKVIHERNCPDSSSGCGAFTSSAKPGGSLMNSNSFQVESGITYSGGISVRVPTGIKVKVLVRRGSPPYEPISAPLWITGTGAWQKITIAFTARYIVTDARLDIENPSEGMTFHFKDVSLSAVFANPVGAWIGDQPLLPAHHPNRGQDATRPNSVYAKAAADGNAVRNDIGSIGSTYLDIDSTLKLPVGTLPKPGNRLRIRTAAWHVNESIITKVEGNRLSFQPATRHQVQAGQGYFLLGELGMLDSPGEWIFDSSTGFNYVWMPDSTPPLFRQIRLSVLDKGVDLSGRSNIIIDGIDVRYTGLGIDLSQTQNVTVRSSSIKNTIREGILATKAKNINFISNRIQQTGGDAISGSNATTVHAENNDISQSAVAVVGDSVWSLPATTYAAIYTGAYANITGNRISNVGGNGIWAQADWISATGIIENNAISDSCLQINDCAAIYINASSPGTRIASNLIERVKGNVDGLGSSVRTHAIGIYLDDFSTNMTLEGNTVAWADYGIHVHNSFHNQINDNLLHGNRNSQIWFQENENKITSTGDVHDNKMTGNRFFPTNSVPAITITGQIDSLTDFGILSQNHYSALFSKRIISESWPTHNLTYTLPEWVDGSGNSLRPSQDVGSSQLLQEGYATYLVAGENVVPNGAFKNGKSGWSSWNETAPLSTSVFETCSLGPCLRITAGGSATLAASPNFSVESNRAYRVSFDAKTNTNGNFIVPTVRRGGPLPLFERLMPSEGFAGSSDWRRYTFIFTAAKTVTVGDPITGDLGARMDFENILPGQTLWLANVEIVPLLSVENTLRTQLVTNADRIAQSRECPDQETAPEYCSLYHLFPDGTPVNWPIDLPPFGAVSIYTINQDTRDSDGDGVADRDDLCPTTSKADQVNASGCALTQIPQPMGGQNTTNPISASD